MNYSLAGIPRIPFLLLSIFSLPITVIKWPFALDKAKNYTWEFYMQQNLSRSGIHPLPARDRVGRRPETIPQRIISL